MILVDTREKYPLTFGAYGIDYQSMKLDTGDYTFKHYEDKVCIERKRTICELVINIGSDWKRFSLELQRMQSYEYKYILCEFEASDIYKFPNCACLPKALRGKIRIKPQFIVSRIEFIESEYGVSFIFCPSRDKAEKVIVDLYESISLSV
jgi:ERCC4-type nuclease